MTREPYLIHFDYMSDESAVDFFSKVTMFLESIDKLNHAIVVSFGSDIQTDVKIEELSDGSLRVWLTDRLKKIDDKTIRQYVTNPKEALADFLIVAKRRLLKLLETDNNIVKNAPIVLENAIQETPLRDYGYKIRKTQVLTSMSDISHTSKEFKVIPAITIDGDIIRITQDFNLDLENTEGIEKQVTQKKGAFTIKKPDLAGKSKWTIIDGKPIDVKIIDEDWISSLTTYEVVLGYGDKISGTLTTESYIDEDLEVIEVQYYLDKIEGIVPPKIKKKQSLLEIKEDEK